MKDGLEDCCIFGHYEFIDRSTAVSVMDIIILQRASCRPSNDLDTFASLVFLSKSLERRTGLMANENWSRS